MKKLFSLPPPPRYPDCVNYSQCLTQAALRNAHDLGCSECDRYEPTPLDSKELSLWTTGCDKLLAKLFDRACSEAAWEGPERWVTNRGARRNVPQTG